jgi:hypothetical protein
MPTRPRRPKRACCRSAPGSGPCSRCGGRIRRAIRCRRRRTCSATSAQSPFGCSDFPGRVKRGGRPHPVRTRGVGPGVSRCRTRRSSHSRSASRIRLSVARIARRASRRARLPRARQHHDDVTLSTLDAAAARTCAQSARGRRGAARLKRDRAEVGGYCDACRSGKFPRATSVRLSPTMGMSCM